MSHRPLALFLGATLVCAGCGQRPVTLQQRLLSQQNPTNYEVDATVKDVKGAMKKAFDKWFEEQAKNNRKRVWKGGGDADAKRLLTKPENENDAYFYATDSPVGESSVYFKDGQPLIYFANFHIHLSVVEPRKSRVGIVTYDSAVNTGAHAGWSPAHGRRFLYVPVDPTTVEEYQILLRIGDELGAKGMPPLVTPETDSAVKTITKSRKG